MKKTVTMVLTAVLSLLILIASVLSGYSFAVKSGYFVWVITILLCVIGVIGGYFVHNVFHEVGHMLFAKKSGGIIFEIAFCGFVFKKADKLKVKFNPKSTVAGWTTFIPSSPEKSLNVLVSSLLGGMTGSVLCFFIGLILFVLGFCLQNYYLVTIFGGYVSVTLYMIGLNFLSLKKGTDGSLMQKVDKKLSTEFLTALFTLEIQSNLLAGKTLNQIDGLYCKPLMKKIITCYDVKRCLQRGEVNQAKELLSAIKNDENFDDNGHIDLLLEELFINLLLNDPVCKIQGDNLEGFLSQDTDNPTVLRVAVYYRRFQQEYEWANALEKSFYRAVRDCPIKGLAKTEVEIYEKYLNK